MYDKVRAGVTRASCNVWYKLSPGTEPRCEHISYTTVCDKDGRSIKAYGIGQNITRQKLAEAEYDRLRTQLTGNLSGIVSSTQLNLSRNLYIRGYSPYPGVESSLQRKTADEHFAAAAASIDNERIKSSILAEYTCSNLIYLFRNGRQQHESIYPVRTSHRGIMWVRTTIQMMQNPINGDIEAITYSRDITEQKRNHEIIGRLSSTGCDYIGVIDVSEHAFKMHTSNWDCPEIAAGDSADYNTIRNILADGYIIANKRRGFLDAISICVITSALRTKPQYIAAFDFIDPDMPDIPLKKQIIFSWLNDEKREILCIQQDVTEAYRKEQEQIRALEKAKLEADAANEAKSAFLSGMSHDLRTPLNGVLGFTAFALKENDPQKRLDYLHKIDTSGKLLHDLIDDTLELSRIESGKAKLDTEAVMLDDLISAVTTAMKPSAELKNINFAAAFDIDASSPVWCDRLKVQKIALNLISNAIKYTPAGGNVSVSLKAEPNGSNELSCILNVDDTGIGMSEEFTHHMYEPFSQEKRSEAVNEPGTGLGLSIVKRYLDLMGGTINVVSRLHEGTHIQVCFIFQTEDTEPARKYSEAAAVESLKGRHILLCEDNYMNTEIAVMLLKEYGMTVDTAINGKEGLDKYAASDIGCFDAILMDIRMPVMDGYQAVRLIRELERPDAACIPIIAMTADAFEESVREAKTAGMNAYVTKPVEPQTLYQTLSQCIVRQAGAPDR